MPEMLSDLNINRARDTQELHVSQNFSNLALRELSSAGREELILNIGEEFKFRAMQQLRRHFAADVRSCSGFEIELAPKLDPLPQPEVKIETNPLDKIL